MRAVVVNAVEGPDAVSVTSRDVRDPGPDEVTIEVHAAAVNPADIALWKSLGGGALAAPFVPGMDAAGVVVATGPDVTRVKVGQRVMAVVNPRRPDGGAQAERVTLPESWVTAVAGNLTYTEASTVPMNGLTAREAMRILDPAPGRTLAVTGGAGVLASYAIAMAKQRGALVIADAKPEDEALVRGFGADHVVPRGPGFSAAVRRIVPDGVDAVFDTANVTTAAVPAVRDGGKIVFVRTWDDELPGRGITAERVSVGNAFGNTAWLDELSADAAADRLPLRVAQVVPVEHALEAYGRVLAGGLRGRLVVAFSNDAASPRRP